MVVHAGFERCPSCRCALRADGIKWNAAMGMLLASVQIKCGEGCLWTGKADAYTDHKRHCQAKRLKEAEAARDQAARESRELCAALTQSRADHTRDVATKEEALSVALAAGEAEASELRKLLATATHEKEEQLKMKDRALAAQRRRLVTQEEEAQHLQELVRDVLSTHEDYKTKVEREMEANRSALARDKSVALPGRARSRSPARAGK